MMTAYQPQPGGAMHPGMAPHGHPAMTPGQPMNPAQMQQMGHPGPVTPGPHVTQGQAMMGMQPGANAMAGHAIGGQHPGMAAQMAGQNIAGGAPNAHTMNHMNPQAALQQQQIMQQQMQANPQLVQQQMMQRRMAQMQANGGMPGMQHAAMQGLNAQQMQQLQQNSMAHAQGGQMPQLPQHLQAQQLQLHMAQQQQRQAAAVAQQNQQMQQQLAMQQANSQQSNQGAQAAAQGQQAAQPQRPGQPMRPQSRMANPNEQSQGGPQQGPQQTPQQSQAQQAQQQQQQAQAQAQAQQAQQGQSSQQQAQTPNQQQQGQQMASQNAQQLQAMQRQRAAQMQQQNAMQQQRQMQQQMQLQQAAQQQQSGGGQFILRAILFADQLSGFNSESGKDIAQWHNFVDKHFAPEGRFIHSFPAQSAEVTGRKFEVARPTIPRYFQMYFDSNATAVRLHLEHVREGGLAGNRHHVTFNHATLTITYSNGARLELDGWAKMLFKDSDAIELMELHTLKSEEHINRSEIERVLANYSPNMANKSPKATKSKLPKAQQKLQSQFDGLTIDHFPKTPKSILGTSDRVQQFLEISETMNIMADLVSFAQEKKMRPEPAIDALVQIYEAQGGSAVQQQPQQGNPQINLPPNGVPSGNRTPSMQNMQIANAQGANLFNSPSVANLNLPMQNGVPGMNGSPHIAHNQGLAPNNMNMANSHSPSPHQTNMAAPMVPQHSQQGTNSSAASANTSPNVNNKRRRSTVKTENDDGAAEGSQGANRVKPSPRMPKKAKPGGGG